MLADYAAIKGAVLNSRRLVGGQIQLYELNPKTCPNGERTVNFVSLSPLQGPSTSIRKDTGSLPLTTRRDS